MTVLLNLGGTIALCYQEGKPRDADFQMLVGRDVRVIDVAPTSSNGLEWRHLRTLRETMLASWRTGETRFAVTVGTDALEEVLYFLSLVRPPNTAIAVVGAVRPRSAPESDGPPSLSLAFQWLESRSAGGVVASCGGRLIEGRRVRKVFRNGWTFQPCLPADEGLSPWALNERCRLLERQPRVPILPVGVGLGAWLAEILGPGRFEGVVVEAFGAGDVPPALVQPLRRLLSRRIPVVLSSRSTPGRVEPLFPGIRGSSHELLASGALSAGALDSARARIRLLVALAARPHLPAEKAFTADRGSAAADPTSIS
jgi:L-asparaginase